MSDDYFEDYGALVHRLTVAEKALRFYADEANYYHAVYGAKSPVYGAPVLADKGATARAALREEAT